MKMPARIVMVHDDRAFLDQVAFALRVEGHEVIAFNEQTRVTVFPRDPVMTDIRITQSNGARAGVRIKVTAYPEASARSEGWGASLPDPLTSSDVVLAVRRLLP
jgi:DNA-binding NtrC family response regulator